ncbi:MAG: hypothetical protein HQ469_07285 [Cyanobacteria bacterium]|nr:hypothetical protein [Cyanobacteria bacterium bin.275]
MVFLAVEVLAAPDGTPFNWATNPVVAWCPAEASWLNALPPTALFISLLALPRATGTNLDRLPPEPPGAPARANHSAAIRYPLQAAPQQL